MDFLTETLQLPKEKLWVTVFEEDDELTRFGQKKSACRKIGLAALVPKITFGKWAIRAHVVRARRFFL